MPSLSISRNSGLPTASFSPVGTEGTHPASGLMPVRHTLVRCEHPDVVAPPGRRVVRGAQRACTLGTRQGGQGQTADPFATARAGHAPRPHTAPARPAAASRAPAPAGGSAMEHLFNLRGAPCIRHTSRGRPRAQARSQHPDLRHERRRLLRGESLQEMPLAELGKLRLHGRLSLTSHLARTQTAGRDGQHAPRRRA